jgi:hypothetical protein
MKLLFHIIRQRKLPVNYFNQTMKILALSTVSSLFLTLETAAANYGWQPESLKEISQLQLRVSKKGCPIGISPQNLQSGITTHLIKNGIPINKTNQAERIPYKRTAEAQSYQRGW